MWIDVNNDIHAAGHQMLIGKWHLRLCKDWLLGGRAKKKKKKEELDKQWYGDDIRGAREVDKWGLNAMPHRFGRPGFIPAFPCFFPAGSCRSSRFVQRFVVASQANGRKEKRATPAQCGDRKL